MEDNPKVDIQAQFVPKNENSEKRIDVVYLKAEEINTNFGNPRKISKKNREELQRSIEVFGDFGCFIVDENNSVIGGNDYEYSKVRTLYELVKKSDFQIYHCKNTEAEIIKYMENCYLVLKVIFCNQFKDIADLYHVSYTSIRDGFVLDKRVGKSHTFVYDDYRGYDSKCLNKDIPAIISAIRKAGFSDKFIMEDVDTINKNYRGK